MNTALIVAAGTGSRTQLNQSKVLFEIDHKPLFLYSVETFLSMGYEIVLVVNKNDIQDFRKYVSDKIKLVIGGKTRSESVMNGLKEVETPYVYIHDAARPLITQKAILEIEKSLQFHDAVLLAEKVTSALKRLDNGSLQSLHREDYVLAQTPQAFLTEKIRYAYLRTQQSYDDDIALYQAFYPEEKIKVVIHDEPNLKVTYPQDLLYVKNHLERDEAMRIGHSFDIHQLVEGRPLILGGIQIPHTMGLLGHSDADVLLHAIGESILGALALGDLGTHFPDTTDAYKGISSVKLIQEIMKLAKTKGYGIQNVDATVYAELPKLNPYISQIRESIALILDISKDDVSVKATTYEKMDAIGQQKAMAAEAVVLMKRL